jgi:hypothetical protein
MKRSSLLVLPLSLGIFLFSLILTVEPSRGPAHFRPEAGDYDDPDARAEYEWRMLRDPRTNELPRDIRRKELEFASKLPTTEGLAKLGRLAKGQLATWTSRGPINQGGRTRALAIDISNENNILAGGVSGGMWRSTDGGTSWTRTTSLNAYPQSVTCIAQDLRVGKRNIWYYGTGELVGNSASGGGATYRGDGIFKSTNSGATWTLLASTSTATPQTFDQLFDYVWNIAVDTSNAAQDEVYAATYGAIYRSTDGGTSWTPVRGGGSPYSVYTDVAVTTTGVVYATMSSGGAAAGIWRSPDGATWTNITPAGWPASYNRVVIGIAPSNENVVYFLAETPGSGSLNHNFWKYTYVSGDGSGSGGTWVDRTSNIPAFGNPVGNFSSQGGYDLIVKVKPDNENVVFIGGTNLYRSTDGFATTTNTAWIGGYATANNVTQYATHHPDQHSMAFLPSNSSVLISGHDGGISKTTNNLAGSGTNGGLTWTSLNSGYVTSQFYSVAIDHGTSGNSTVIGGLQDNGHLFSNGSTAWVVLPAGGDGCITAIANGRTYYYICTQNGNGLRLTLDESTGQYNSFAAFTPSGASGQLFVTPYVLDPTNSNIMYYAAGDRIWRNSDLSGLPVNSQAPTSVNWALLTNTVVTGANVTALGVSKSLPANRLYYGSSNGKVFKLDGANSGDPSPVEITDAGFPANAYVSCIAVNPRNADTAIVVFSNYNVPSLFLTTNGGTTWTDVSGNLEQNANGTGNGPSCRWAAILPSGGSAVYYVGTSTGLYSTTTLNGASTVWAQEGASVIGNVVVTMVQARQSDGFIVAATHGNGVFTATVSTSVVEIPSALPATFNLEQNYPNPFNPSTKIRYSIAERGHVRLRVYDATGKEVASLVNQEQTAGTYEATWDSRASTETAVSSGVYFARLEHGNRVAVQKMVLLK